jgi:hypothetical protein
MRLIDIRDDVKIGHSEYKIISGVRMIPLAESVIVK